jgi:GTP pyrophosphokinase
MVQITRLTVPQSVLDDECFQWCESNLLIKPFLACESKENSTSPLIESIQNKNNVSLNLFRKMFVFFHKKLDSHNQLFLSLSHSALHQALLLTHFNVDPETFIAAILYPFVKEEWLPLNKIESSISLNVKKRIEGVILLDGMRGLQNKHPQNDAYQIENLRKMLLVMVDDVMVVLIKLAERLVSLREAKNLSQSKQVELAKEIQMVYAPLANRLGVGQIKWEMEDLAFRYLYPLDYKKIAHCLSEKRLDREIYVQAVLSKIDKKLKMMNIQAQLMGRAKHIYSIWKKMQRKKVGFEDIYDVRAVRVLVPKVQDCYSALGVIHGEWKHIPKEFDDYVATPKENGYRSLHTAVVGPEGKTLEIQIRTHKMHQESELGVAAHWQYKEGKTNKASAYDDKMAWLRQVLDWQDELMDTQALAENFKNQLFEERVYVFTPLGQLIDLPQGSTAIDFAYRIHTDVGHRCRGAKANGRIISLTQALLTGQKIEILTCKKGAPSRDWLNEYSAYTRSQQAKSKISQWFKHQDKEKNKIAGKLLFETEIKKNDLQRVFEKNQLKPIIEFFNFNHKDEFYVALGAGDKGIHQVINYVRSQYNPNPSVVPEKLFIKKSQIPLASHSFSGDILVEGVGKLLTRMATCCKPVPGDDIAGYVTIGRGIIIHQSDCRHLLRSQNKTPEKVLQVSWVEHVHQHYLIDLLIHAYDRKGLLSDITALLSHEKVSVMSLHTQVNVKKLEFTITMQIKIPHLHDIPRLMTLIEQLNNIISVHRTRL